MIRVEVAYALPNRQQILELEVEKGCTVYEAAARSGITGRFPEIDLEKAKMGIFGQVVPKPKETPVEDGDRVEIYRPLQVDPKQVRKQRAEEAKARRKAEKGSGDSD